MDKIIINVGRQLGSGGRVVARLLAQEFGCRFYDRELLNLAAQESGFSEKFFAQNDEHKGFFRSLFHTHLPLLSDTNIHANRFSEESLFQFQSDAIRKAAAEGSCVFVGRCADYILRDMPECVNIFITARLEYRVRQVSARAATRLPPASSSRSRSAGVPPTTTTIPASVGAIVPRTICVWMPRWRDRRKPRSG